MYQFIEDPILVLPLLTHLRRVPSLYMRRSVVNHLNDIAKDHPELVVQTLRDWHKDGDENLDWITRRALRTLIKDGCADALALIGFGEVDVTVTELRVEPPQNLVQSPPV